jgi:hypothetical protein
MTRIDQDAIRKPDEPQETCDRTHSADGVDLTLIRWMLSMTPEERLRTLQNVLWSLWRLKHAARKT